MIAGVLIAGHGHILQSNLAVVHIQTCTAAGGAVRDLVTGKCTIGDGYLRNLVAGPDSAALGLGFVALKDGIADVRLAAAQDNGATGGICSLVVFETAIVDIQLKLIVVVCNSQDRAGSPAVGVGIGIGVTADLNAVQVQGSAGVHMERAAGGAVCGETLHTGAVFCQLAIGDDRAAVHDGHGAGVTHTDDAVTGAGCLSTSALLDIKAVETDLYIGIDHLLRGQYHIISQVVVTGGGGKTCGGFPLLPLYALSRGGMVSADRAANAAGTGCVLMYSQGSKIETVSGVIADDTGLLPCCFQVFINQPVAILGHDLRRVIAIDHKHIGITVNGVFTGGDADGSALFQGIDSQLAAGSTKIEVALFGLGATHTVYVVINDGAALNDHLRVIVDGSHAGFHIGVGVLVGVVCNIAAVQGHRRAVVHSNGRAVVAVVFVFGHADIGQNRITAVHHQACTAGSRTVGGLISGEGAVCELQLRLSVAGPDRAGSGFCFVTHEVGIADIRAAAADNDRAAAALGGLIILKTGIRNLQFRRCLTRIIGHDDTASSPAGSIVTVTAVVADIHAVNTHGRTLVHMDAAGQSIRIGAAGDTSAAGCQATIGDGCLTVHNDHRLRVTDTDQRAGMGLAGLAGNVMAVKADIDIRLQVQLIDSRSGKHQVGSQIIVTCLAGINIAGRCRGLPFNSRSGSTVVSTACAADGAGAGSVVCMGRLLRYGRNLPLLLGRNHSFLLNIFFHRGLLTHCSDIHHSHGEQNAQCQHQRYKPFHKRPPKITKFPFAPLRGTLLRVICIYCTKHRLQSQLRHQPLELFVTFSAQNEVYFL